MKRIQTLISFFSVFIAFNIFLTGCTVHSAHNNQVANFLNQEKIEKTAQENYPQKTAQQVSVFDAKKKPATPYKVIGIATILKKNLLGEPRQNSVIHDRMKQLAASIGGDGILKIDHHQDKVVATIIAYQKILI